jgi:N-acetyl-gamma-glutamyl-phosphate reductase
MQITNTCAPNLESSQSPRGTAQKLAKLIRVGIVGATGYAGQELVRLLLGHPQVEIKALASKSKTGKSFASVYPGFSKFFDLNCVEEDSLKMAESVDLLFFALPHGAAAQQVDDRLLEMVPIVDLGSDFRLKDPGAYEKWYGFKHPRPDLLSQSAYGLSELRRKEIAAARIVANPGCYATGTILALKPLIDASILDPKSIVIDAKSGVSGAGRSLSLDLHFDECNETVKAYKVASHRHIPEMEQELANGKGQFPLTFTPHLIPMNRGILVTAYGSLVAKTSEKAIGDLYRKAYDAEHFIRLFEPQGQDEYAFPETRFVKGTNFCDIGWRIDERTNRLIVVAALDNLVKGAAGQAIQNMNLLFDLPETTGLKQIPIFPA